MGYVLLGLAALGEIGMTGAVLQMFTHGTITGLLFALVGLVYDKTHTRQIPELRGLAHRMPFVATVFGMAALASLGLPTMSGFVAEFLVFVGTYPVFGVHTVLGAAGVVLAAAYMLWVVERSFFRTVSRHLHDVRDATLAERVPLAVLVASIMVVGLWPRAVTDVIRAGLLPIIERLG
jgi:NADH-quinone oxidoreductase subunit M